MRAAPAVDIARRKFGRRDFRIELDARDKTRDAASVTRNADFAVFDGAVSLRAYRAVFGLS